MIPLLIGHKVRMGGGIWRTLCAIEGGTYAKQNVYVL